VQNANKPTGNAQIASVEIINDRYDKICEMLENIYKDKSPIIGTAQRTDATATGVATSTYRMRISLATNAET